MAFPTINTVTTHGEEKERKHTIQGVVAATFTLGALLGVLSCPWAGDKFGRRKTICAASTLTLLGEVLECSAFQLPQLIVRRTVLGFEIGMLSAITPVWQAETSTSSDCGRNVVLSGLFIALGYVLQAWINPAFFQIKTGSLSWRLPIAMPGLVSIMLMGTVWMFPESARWLVPQGRLLEARHSLAMMTGTSVEDDD